MPDHLCECRRMREGQGHLHEDPKAKGHFLVKLLHLRLLSFVKISDLDDRAFELKMNYRIQLLSSLPFYYIIHTVSKLH